MIYGIAIAFIADITYDLLGHRLYILVLLFPYRFVHRNRIDQARCNQCHHYHTKGHKNVAPRRTNC